MLAKLFAPLPVSTTVLPSDPGNEQVAMEWLLKSGVMDEVSKTVQLPSSTSALPYFGISEESDDHTTRSSPTSSDASVVEIPSVAFNEFT